LQATIRNSIISRDSAAIRDHFSILTTVGSICLMHLKDLLVNIDTNKFIMFHVSFLEHLWPEWIYVEKLIVFRNVFKGGLLFKIKSFAMNTFL